MPAQTITLNSSELRGSSRFDFMIAKCEMKAYVLQEIGARAMTATLHLLHPQISPLAGFLRIGHNGHRKIEAMQASGRFPFKRVVFEACHIDQQKDLVATLANVGCEIVLDPNFAEMATLGKYSSAVSKLPWANSDRPWCPDDFGRGRNHDIARAIAEFAVAHNINVVLAPSHLIESVVDPWRTIDSRMCEALRSELDRAGGSDIAIDYQLIRTSSLLKDAQGRRAMIEDVAGLPIDNVWLRTSGFGATATGVGTRHFIESVRHLHQIGRPLIADAVGGLAGLATGAFGAVGGIAHGAGQKESFNCADWRKLPEKKRGGGSAQRIYVHDLDRYFNEDQLTAVFSARGGRSRFGCNDTTCCPSGESMAENAHDHFITQRSKQIENLSSVPEARREEHFLLRHMDPVVRSARHAVRLRIQDEKVAKAIADAKSRIIRLSDALADLHETQILVTKSRSPAFRGGGRGLNALFGQ